MARCACEKAGYISMTKRRYEIDETSLSEIMGLLSHCGELIEQAIDREGEHPPRRSNWETLHSLLTNVAWIQDTLAKNSYEAEK